MFNKFFKFLKGYVIIRIYGKNTERFINICTRRNIRLHYLKYLPDGYMESCVDKRNFKLLRPVAFKTKTSVAILKKKGLFDIYRRYGGRYALITGAVMFLLFFIISTRFVWAVEINGVEISNYASIADSLERSGIYPGARKSEIDEISEVKKRILRENDTVSWAWAYIEGGKVRVEVYERILPPEVFDRNLPCDIVTGCDGVIKSIIVKNGYCDIKTGDAVSAGQTLIFGKVPLFKEGEEEKYMYVHAAGVVEAYTSHKAKERYSTYYETNIPTGRKRRMNTLELFGKEFPLYFKKSVDYSNYVTDEKRYELNIPFWGYSGIGLNSVLVKEAELKREMLGIETVLDFAQNELEEKISKQLAYDATLINKELTYEYVNDETIEVELVMNFIEKIGTQVPIDISEE